ncbi:MAG: uroporphyrinogen decarboxylase [Pseudolysinimonas sp.]
MPGAPIPSDSPLPVDHPLRDGRTSSSTVVRAYRGDRPETLPVWFMGQAGLSLREGDGAGQSADLLNVCLTPERASEITLQPVRRHRVDAAILFSDIVVPIKLAGVEVHVVPGRGPVFDSPIRTASDVLRLPPLDPDALEPIREAVAMTVAQLGATPLIALGGAPFTLASSLIEGGPSSNQLRARAMMYADPHSWAALLNWCADVTGAFLRAQVDAGASAAQLFDTRMGSLSRRDYQRRVRPHTERALSALRGLDVAKVHFGVGSADVLDLIAGIADIVGVDWRLPLDEAALRLGGAVPVQGNIDPALLAAPWPTLEAHVRDVIERGTTAPAHVLNLGHRVPPGADPEVLTRIVDLAHELG